MPGLRRLRDGRGNGTDFWLSPNRTKSWTAGARARASVEDERTEGERVDDASSSSSDVRAEEEGKTGLDQAPAVFVGFPHASYVCGTCRDVYDDPVVASDGETYCVKCVPRGLEVGATENAEVEDGIQALAVLCRRALTLRRNASGESEWTWKADGCGENGIRLRMRDVHDRECGFRQRRCWYPHATRHEATARDDSRAGRDYCGYMTTKFAYAAHAATCEWRAEKCDVVGCEEMVPHCKREQHIRTCPKARVSCPNACEWEGERGDLATHRASCEREYVKCEFIDLEREHGAGCMHGCERALIEAHRHECDFRPWCCPSCNLVINAINASAHAMKCGDARQRCPRCRAMVREAAFKAHTEHFCAGSATSCAYASFGCREQGTREELRQHERESAPRHLRLVVKSLDDERSKGLKQAKIIERMEKALTKFGEDYSNLTSKAAERVKFVESRAIEQIETLQAHLEANKRAYEEHVEGLNEEIDKLKAERDAAVDADAHLAKLDSAITIEQANVLIAASKAEFTKCTTQLAKLTVAIEASERQWENDIQNAQSRDEEIAERCRREVESVLATQESNGIVDAISRVDTLSSEIRELSRTMNLDLLTLAEKQSELEALWRASNESWRPPLTPLASAVTRSRSSPSPSKARRRFKSSDTASASETASEKSIRRLGSATMVASRATDDWDRMHAPPPPSFIASTDGSDGLMSPPASTNPSEAEAPIQATRRAGGDDVFGAVRSLPSGSRSKTSAPPAAPPRPPWIEFDDD